MIISSSSFQVQLADELCEYVESSLRKAFESHSDLVESIDARLETVARTRSQHDTNVVLRVDLLDNRTLVSETRDKDLRTAIRRAAADSARSVDHTRQQVLTRARLPAKPLAYGSHSVASI